MDGTGSIIGQIKVQLQRAADEMPKGKAVCGFQRRRCSCFRNGLEEIRVEVTVQRIQSKNDFSDDFSFSIDYVGTTLEIIQT